MNYILLKYFLQWTENKRSKGLSWQCPSVLIPSCLVMVNHFFINKCWRQFGGFLFACDKTVEWEWANKIVRWENVCLPNTCVRPDFVIVPRFEQDNEFHHFRPLQIRRLSCYPECLDVCVFTTVHKNLINIWHVGLHNKETKPRFFFPIITPRFVHHKPLWN